jgi:hypothetical protein
VWIRNAWTRIANLQPLTHSLVRPRMALMLFVVNCCKVRTPRCTLRASLQEATSAAPVRPAQISGRQCQCHTAGRWHSPHLTELSILNIIFSLTNTPLQCCSVAVLQCRSGDTRNRNRDARSGEHPLLLEPDQHDSIALLYAPYFAHPERALLHR